MGSGEWLLAVIGAVAAQPPTSPSRKLPKRERRAELERLLRESGLAYGAGAEDRAVELDSATGPARRAFAHFVAGLVRLCQRAASMTHARWFVPGKFRADEGVNARRAQLLAILAAAAGERQAAAKLFAHPPGAEGVLGKLADRVATRLTRRYLAERGPYSGLPLHTGLCAIEVRICATLSLAAFEHQRLSPGAVVLADKSALRWRSALVELLSGLAHAQGHARDTIRGLEQVIRSQRLPVREARMLRRALQHPRPVEQIAVSLHPDALRRFAVTQILLAAFMDRSFDAGEVAYVERLAKASGLDPAELKNYESEVEEFYRRNLDALRALRLAEEPEALSHALSTRLEALVLDNFDRLVQEIRETGELAELLAKAAAGGNLDAVDKAKVREQLIDLAKTIPALAIFAAPGGALLLPILLKLLPFSLLPSSFVDRPEPTRALRERRLRSG